LFASDDIFDWLWTANQVLYRSIEENFHRPSTILHQLVLHRITSTVVFLIGSVVFHSRL
jgi:hypothetical protein